MRKLKPQFSVSFDSSSTYEPFYHLNGFTHGNLQIITSENPKIIRDAQWGIVPNWAIHDPVTFRKKSNTLNARSESVFEKASYRESAEEQRCLILSDGFFEPHHENGNVIPYFCYQPSKEHPKGELFLFAGIYNSLLDGTLTTTVLTLEANDFFAQVHNKAKRMPLVLNPHYYEDWLDNGLNNSQINEIIASGMTETSFEAHPVSKDLYKKNIYSNKPYIIEKVEKGTLF